MVSSILYAPFGNKECCCGNGILLACCDAVKSATLYMLDATMKVVKRITFNSDVLCFVIEESRTVKDDEAEYF